MNVSTPKLIKKPSLPNCIFQDSVAIVKCEGGNISTKGEWTLDAEKRACIEVTYFSPNSSLTLTVGNKVFNAYKNEVTLLVSGAFNLCKISWFIFLNRPQMAGKLSDF
jgi:hypothetical protein